MKLRDIPDPVWYGLLAVAVAGGVWWLGKRAADAAGDAVKGAGQAAYNAGNAVQDAIVPGTDTLGTWLYGIFHPEETVKEKPAGGWTDNGQTEEWFFDYDKLDYSDTSTYPVVQPPAGQPRRPGVNVPRFSRPY